MMLPQSGVAGCQLVRTPNQRELDTYNHKGERMFNIGDALQLCALIVAVLTLLEMRSHRR